MKLAMYTQKTIKRHAIQGCYATILIDGNRLVRRFGGTKDESIENVKDALGELQSGIDEFLGENK